MSSVSGREEIVGSEPSTLKLALSFFDGPTDAEAARRAVAMLLGQPRPPRPLLHRIRDALAAPNVEPATVLQGDERGSRIVWYDAQLSPDVRDLINAHRFFSHGFTYRRGQEKRDRGLTAAEDAECRRGMARLLSADFPATALLVPLAALIAPTKPFGSTVGWLVLNDGRLELQHRGKGRTSSFFGDIEVAVRVREQLKRCPGSDAAAIEAVATALGRPPATVKTQLVRGRRHLTPNK